MDNIIQVLNRNKGLAFAYMAIGLFNAFMVNFKAHFFQRVIDIVAQLSRQKSKIFIMN